ncbi:MAG: glycosyltransferase family 4 protein, partial [Nitrospirales bacterium]
LYGLPRERIAVIPNGVSEEFRPVSGAVHASELRNRLGIPTDRFILFVGGADPRKNHRTLVKAYAERAAALKECSLVLVGDAVHTYGDMRAAAREHRVEDRVVYPGRLPVSDLRLLYSNAAVFVFPSIYEGFGMPVLEAMACGAPVITSNTTALPEVAGDAALLVNPEDANAMADAILRVVEDEAFRESLRAKGLERAKQFTWERTARETLALYREVCGEGDR